MKTYFAIAILAILALTSTAGVLHVVLGPPPGTRPAYRFWNNKTGAHFFTMDADEKTKLEIEYNHIWVYEGIAFYAWPDPNQTVVEIVER